MLGRLNGWQRIWVVLTCLGLLAAVLVPYFVAYKFNASEWDYERALEKDLKNPACQTIAAAPLGSLKEPGYDTEGGTCWHIYTSRQYSETGKVPYTLEVYREDKDAYRFDQYLIGVASLGAFALICSALVYGAGAVIAWITRGFRKTKNNA